MENLGISKIEKQNSLYNSRNLYEIFRKLKKILKNPKLILEIPKFIRKFRNAIAKQNSGISWIFNRAALQKEIWPYH